MECTLAAVQAPPANWDDCSSTNRAASAASAWVICRFRPYSRANRAAKRYVLLEHVVQGTGGRIVAGYVKRALPALDGWPSINTAHHIQRVPGGDAGGGADADGVVDDQRLSAGAEVLEELGGVARAEGPHVDDLARHLVQVGPGAFQKLDRTADEEAELAGPHTFRNADHTGVDDANAARVTGLGNLAGGLRQNGAMQEHQSVRLGALQDATRP